MEENQFPCNVIRDLMPLVCDGAGSTESENIVTEHIKTCPECQHIWELFHRKDCAVSPSSDKLAEKQGFQKSLKKQKRKFGIWKAVAILCALTVLCGAIFAIINQNTEKSVPVSMFQNAHLFTTKQGCVFMKFTPDEKFPSITGMSGGSVINLNGNPIEEFGTEYDYDYRFFYNALDPKYGDGTPNGLGLMVSLPNGDSIHMLGYHYLLGKLMITEDADLAYWQQYKDRKEITALLAMGVSPSCFRESNVRDLYLSDGKDRQLIYHNGDVIPLCDGETQEIIDSYFKKGRWNSDDLLSCLYAGDENDAEMQEELKKMQEYQLELFEGQELTPRKG